MKILVISDIHGLVSYAERMIEKEKPDEVVFCGDGWREIDESRKFFKHVRFHTVGGNCDFCGEPELYITLGGKNIFITHGHRYNVKMERELAYITLRAHASEMGADLVLFGHTHYPDIVYRDGMIIVNPGAVMAGKYGVVEINGEEIKPQLKSL